MNEIKKRVSYRIATISIISVTVIVGNIFNILWTWGHNPRWVSVATTLVAICSIFAWTVAITFFIED